MTIKHDIRSGAIRELADMYKNPLAFIRELGSNVYDQSKHPNAKGRKPVVRLYVHRLRRKIESPDEMTGIEDTKEFVAIGTETTSRDSGKTVGDATNSYANINPDIIGQKHMGKLSYLYATKEGKIGDVEFYSNNGRNGQYLKLGYDGWQGFDLDGNETDDPNALPFKYIDKIEALTHVGLKPVLNDLKDDCISIKKIELAAQKWFGLLLKRKKLAFQIIDVDNGNKVIDVHAHPDLKTNGEKTDDSLKMSKGGNIRVNLEDTEQPSLGPNVDIYHKEIYVCSIKVGFMIKGYVDWDGFELDPPRQTYKDSPEFEETFSKYLTMHHQKDILPKSKPIDKKETKVIEEILGEVLSAIQKVNYDLLPELFGPKDKTGVIGLVGKGISKQEYKQIENASIDPNQKGNEPIIWTGDGTITDGGGGTGTGDGGDRVKIIDDGKGTHSVKIRDAGKNEQVERNVMPNMIISGAPHDKEDTLFVKIVDLPDGTKAIVLTINTARPAHYSIVKVGGKTKTRDFLADKMIRAIYKVTYTGSSIAEFEKKVDDTWNAMYQ